MNIKIILFIGVIFIFIFILYLRCKRTVENFDDANDANAADADSDYFNKEYLDLYSTTFNYLKMYKNDMDIINNKVIKNLLKKSDDIKILDAGCGLGKHMKYIYKKYNTIGVDRSKNMLKKAKINCPNGTFILGDMVNSNLFDPQSIDIIYSLTDSIYHNNHDIQIDIFKNFKSWLKPNGYLCLHIFNKNKLDPGPMDFTQYKVINDIKNSVTHFDDFSHVANFKVSKKFIEYNEIYERDGKDNLTKVTKLYIDKKDIHIEKILSIGFKLVDVYSLKNLHINDFELYIFKKN